MIDPFKCKSGDLISIVLDLGDKKTYAIVLKAERSIQFTQAMVVLHQGQIKILEYDAEHYDLILNNEYIYDVKVEWAQKTKSVNKKFLNYNKNRGKNNP